MYDLVAGIQCLKSSYILSKTKALELFPMLKKDKLVGAIVYYDGQSSASGAASAHSLLFSVNTNAESACVLQTFSTVCPAVDRQPAGVSC